MLLILFLATIVQISDIGNLGKNGGESNKVGEHLSAVSFDLEAFPEPKILESKELGRLLRVFGSTVTVARFLGCSQSHVSERLNS